jgi:hypothetical protein
MSHLLSRCAGISTRSVLVVTSETLEVASIKPMRRHIDGLLVAHAAVRAEQVASTKPMRRHIDQSPYQL